MAVRTTIQIGDSRLKADNTIVTNFNDSVVIKIIEDLKDTMHEAGLIGIAAPQIGENYKIFITEPRETATRPKEQADELRVYINPKIVEESDKKVEIFEGCGSVLNGQLFGPVIRPKILTIEAFDLNGKRFRFTADGILGRVIQHEFDHTIGVEFLEKVSDYKRMMTLEHYIEKVKSDPKHQEASKITVKEFEWLD